MLYEEKRKLVTLRKVRDVVPIDNADSIELAYIDGWQVVVKKDTVKKDDTVFYIEIDSRCPRNEYFKFLESRDYKVRTAKFRGVLSQGLIMTIGDALSVLPGFRNVLYRNVLRFYILFEKSLPNIIKNYIQQEYDWDSVFGIVHKDSLYSSSNTNESFRNLPSYIKGGFPSFLKKTDQERIQNLSRTFEKWRTNSSDNIYTGKTYEVTEKLDGTSVTYFLHPYEYNNTLSAPPGENRMGICSRNYELDTSKQSKELFFAVEHNIEEKLRKIYENTGRYYALQGELIGTGIQGNYYNKDSYEWYCFDIWDIGSHMYLSPKQRTAMCEKYNIPQVPVIDYAKDISGMSLDDILQSADGQSLLNPKVMREGLVYKMNLENERFSFKAISNKFLLKIKD